MMNWHAALQTHSQRLGAVAGQAATYRRGAVGVPVTAVVGKTDYEQDNGDGGLVRAQVRDYLIPTAELTGSEIGSLPKSGDQIVETSGECRVWEVMSIDGGPPWRYSGPDRSRVRVHTRQVEGR